MTEADTPSLALLASYAGGAHLAPDASFSRSSGTLHVIVGVQLFGRVALALELPTTLFESFSDGTPRKLDDGVQGGFGDVRFGGRFEAFEAHGGIPGATIGGAVYLPTAPEGALLGGRTARFAPEIAFGGQPSVFSWSTALGGMVDPSTSAEGDSVGSEIWLKGAFAAHIDRFQLGLESVMALGLDDRPGDSLTGLRGELLATARARIGSLSFSIAGGPGFFEAPGTPAYRLIAGLGAAYESAPRRADANAYDRAAAEATRKRAANPATSAEPHATGAEPQAPAHPPHMVCAPLGGACRPDADDDGVADGDDVCPKVAGPATSARPGCPPAAQLTAKSIALGAALMFRAGSDELEPVSEAVLAEVVAILKQNPSIVRLAVDGHTDDRGNERANLALSRARAMAVVRWLNEHGIDARRTEARGFGPRQPVAKNDTEEGRAKNRRVEFVILSQSAAGEAAWIDGTLPGAAK